MICLLFFGRVDELSEELGALVTIAESEEVEMTYVCISKIPNLLTL
jgi:hypothetical protein